MKEIKLDDKQYQMVISGIASEINQTKKLLRRRMNDTLKIHLENRLTNLEDFLQYIKCQ